jgi:ABC-type Fe3+ transport system permease subunit
MNKKPKNPEIDIILAMICCFVFGLMLVGFSLRSFLKHEYDIPSRVDWHNVDSVLIWGQAQLLHTLVFQAIPLSGGAFLLIGFIIWNYRRKRRLLKDSHEPDA